MTLQLHRLFLALYLFVQNRFEGIIGHTFENIFRTANLKRGWFYEAKNMIYSAIISAMITVIKEN